MAVRGIGGVFIYARDAQALVAWYQRHLGIEFAFEGNEKSFYKDFVLARDVAYGREEREVFAIRQAAPGMHTQGDLVINLRVTGIAQLVVKLCSAGVVIEREESHDYGAFAWLRDGEGNRLELFEPAVG